jgi:tRNA 2-thiouridine synthesizing protein A
MQQQPAKREAEKSIGAETDSAPLRLDLLGLKCPMPALKTQAALGRLGSGALLLVEADDPLAIIDIPHLVAQGGDSLIETAKADRVLRFLIRKG